jgi:hypothetical protein
MIVYIIEWYNPSAQMWSPLTSSAYINPEFAQQELRKISREDPEHKYRLGIYARQGNSK